MNVSEQDEHAPWTARKRAASMQRAEELPREPTPKLYWGLVGNMGICVNVYIYIYYRDDFGIILYYSLVRTSK